MEVRRNLFTDGNLTKDCMVEAENDLCHEKATLFGTISLSASSVVGSTWRDRNFLWYYLTLNESADLSSTSQLLVFIRCVHWDLQKNRHLFAECTEQQPEKTFSRKCRKLYKAITFSGISVDVILLMEENMAGVRKILVGQMRTKLEDVQLQGALFIHCIMHQQKLCGKYLDISYVLKPVVSVVTSFRVMLM